VSRSASCFAASARGWVGLLLAGTLSCAVLEPTVMRSVDGVASEGRFIDENAYALYAVAASREARAQWAEALDFYQRAAEIDSRGPELRTRIGAVACKLRKRDLADRAFAAALRADDGYGPLWFELAQCRKSRGDAQGALRAALEALRLDPERVETTLLAADAAEQLGDHASAWRLRDALVTHAPDSLRAQQAMLSAATRAKDSARAERARRELAALHRRGASTAEQRGLPGALHALERGDVTTAARLAEQVLGADPSNGDALVIALCAADLQEDHAGFARLLERARDPGSAASPQVMGILESLLTRRVSAQAGRLVRPQP
jgi:tetratricopeptide (TPR) repeat protein